MKIRGLKPEQFSNRILRLMSNDHRKLFEFYKDSLEGRFLKIFRQRQEGSWDFVNESGSRYKVWSLDNKVRMVITNITVEINRESLIGVINKNIDDVNDYLARTYRENAILHKHYVDPIEVH